MMKKPAVMGMTRCSGARCSARLKLQERQLLFHHHRSLRFDFFPVYSV